ncbi:MAG: PTS sugar transporter subunit IIA [Acetivibrionales bacterium]|jgi:mannitol/fructose-specific phosphotransferase system IIA component
MGFFKRNDDQSSGAATSQSEAGSDVLLMENIILGERSVDKTAAIEKVGQLLVNGGYVMPEYINAMQEREKVLTTYIGNGIAIPHGVGAARNLILKSGIAIVQYPQGVQFEEGKVAYLVVGIAGKGNEHMQILTNLAEFIQDEDVVKELFQTRDKNQIYQAFTSKV